MKNRYMQPDEINTKYNPYYIKKKFTFENIPPIASLADLVTAGKSGKFYKNINNLMLWDIFPHVENLNNLIGMEKLKNSVLYQILYYLQGMQGQNKEGEYMHTIILGPPGTGKTSVARLIGQIYKSMDLFAHTRLPCKFVQANRTNFVAEYLGQTSKKTNEFLLNCLGGILFIDEVYSLGDGNKKDTFSKEAIDTLNEFLSLHSRNFCCIIAGYEEDIKNCFLSVNSGLESRFAWVHRIDEYTTENIVDIFLKMIKEINWVTNIPKSFLIGFFKTNEDIFENKGRDISNFITKCKMVHSKRIFGQSASAVNKFNLTIEDVENAVTMTRSYKLSASTKELYKHMYS